ncbi:MAG: M20 family metallopeptidase [Gemmatimonadota bacterium]
MAKRILLHLAERRSAMVALAEELIRCESPSTDPESLGPILALLGRELRARGLSVRRLAGHGTRGHLCARPAERTRRGPYQLLLGHCDTVWPRGTLATMPVERDGDRLRGPGAFDMKGGLVQLLFALEAVRDLGLRPAVLPVVFINSDEESGSPDSTRHIIRLARGADRALVLEPALGPTGALKTARKGVGSFVVRVHGRRAHGGLDPEAGASAVRELAHVIQSLYALADPAREISVNVGRVEGGTAANVVARDGLAVVDVRVPTREEGRRLERLIHGLRPRTPGTRLEIEGEVGRPPLERTPRNRALWEAARSAAAALGVELEEGKSGGASDGNTTSQYTATLDGLGAVGDGAHADHEFICVDRMVERSALVALLLLLPPLETGRT